MLDTNCKSLAVLTKCAAKGMIARNRVESLTSATAPAPTPTCVSMPGACGQAQQTCLMPLLSQRKRRFDACGTWVQGHIINISSIAASDHYAGGSIYCGTKAFVTAFTDSLRHDLVGTNIRCPSHILRSFLWPACAYCALRLQPCRLPWNSRTYLIIMAVGIPT